jgi:PRC-barrel domain protein
MSFDIESRNAPSKFQKAETISVSSCCPLIRKGGAFMTTTLDTKETVSLIGSDKVEGTAVYGADEKKIGSIERAMIDKISGKVAYAVLSFGGFMGMGEDYYPVPWSTLRYDTNLGGYRVNLTKEQLDRAPKYSKSQGWNWTRENDLRVYDYYRARPYWE